MSDRRIVHRLVTVAAGCAVIATLSACSFSTSAGGKAVKEKDVETQIADQLAANTGERPKSVDCPDNLKAKAGTRMRCTLTAATGKYGVTVTVTSVKDNTVNFDIKVDSKPTP